MADTLPAISKITLPSGGTYEIKDAAARTRLEALEGITGALLWKGVTTTEIKDGGAQIPADVYAGGKTPATGDVVLYGKKEFVWDGAKWQELGDLADLTELMGKLGKLAYENTATGSVSVSGTAAAQTFTGTEATITSSGNTSGVAVEDISYTPAGNVTATASTSETVVTSVDKTNATVKVLDEAGSASAGSAASFTQGTDTFTATVSDEVLTLGFTQGSDTFTANVPTTVTLPSFKDQTVITSVTSEDTSVTIPTDYEFEGSAATLQHTVTQGNVSVTATYTPAGVNGTSSVTASGTVTVAPAE